MRIRYLKGDPRAGMEVVVDNHLGQRQVDRGSAEEVKRETEPANKAEPAPQNKAERVAENKTAAPAVKKAVAKKPAAKKAAK